MHWPWKRRDVAPEPMTADRVVPLRPEPEVRTYPPFADRPDFCTKCGSTRPLLVRFCAEDKLESELHLSLAFAWWTPGWHVHEHLNWTCPECGALVGQTQPANYRADGTAT